MDVDFEKRRMLFFARALALGLRVSYFRTANSSRDNGSIVNYGSTESDLILAFCLSYWLSNNWLLNAILGMDQLRRANRFGEEERSINRFRLATMAIGAGYFYPCFGNFGLLAEAEVGFGYGSDARRLITPTNDPVTTSLNAWSLQAGTYVGLWYAVHRYMVFARMGALSYTLLSVEGNEDFSSGREISTSLNAGLNLKQIAIGMRFMLNYGGQQSRYAQ
jgi:hypothetical protein